MIEKDRSGIRNMLTVYFFTLSRNEHYLEGLQSADAGLQSADAGLQSAEFLKTLKISRFTSKYNTILIYFTLKILKKRKNNKNIKY